MGRPGEEGWNGHSQGVPEEGSCLRIAGAVNGHNPPGAQREAGLEGRARGLSSEVKALLEGTRSSGRMASVVPAGISGGA